MILPRSEQTVELLLVERRDRNRRGYGERCDCSDRACGLCKWVGNPCVHVSWRVASSGGTSSDGCELGHLSFHVPMPGVIHVVIASALPWYLWILEAARRIPLAPRFVIRLHGGFGKCGPAACTGRTTASPLQRILRADKEGSNPKQFLPSDSQPPSCQPARARIVYQRQPLSRRRHLSSPPSSPPKFPYL